MKQIKMSLKETYASWDISGELNMFVETFDNKNFDVILMYYPTFKFLTIETLTPESDRDLCNKLQEIFNRFEDQEIDLKNFR